MNLLKTRVATMALIGILLVASSPVSARGLSHDYSSSSVHHSLVSNESVTAGAKASFTGRFRPAHIRLADKLYPEHSGAHRSVRPQQGANCSPAPFLQQNGSRYYVGNSSEYWRFDFDPSQPSSSNLGFPGDLYFDAAGTCDYTYTNIEGSIALSFVEGGVRYVYGTPNGEYGAWWTSNNAPSNTITDAMTPIAVTQVSVPGSDPLVVTASFLAGGARVDWTLSIGSASISIPYSVTVTAPQATGISNISLYHAYDLDDLSGGDTSPGADGLYEGGQIGSVNSFIVDPGNWTVKGDAYRW